MTRTKSNIPIDEDLKSLKTLFLEGMTRKEISKYYYERGYLISRRAVVDKMEELGFGQASQFIVLPIQGECFHD